MKRSPLFPMWGILFVLCAALGFVPQPEGVLRVVLTAASLVFFLPPALLLYRAAKTGRRGTVRIVRDLAIMSLVVTTVVLLANFLSLHGSEFTGDFLYALLVIVSSPMICSGHWVLPLFCWACLLFAGNHILKTMKTRT